MSRFRLLAHSQIRIESRSSVHPIRWETRGLTGWLEASVGNGRIDTGKPVEGRLEFPVRKLTSGNPLYDRQLPRTVGARKHPTVVASLHELEPREDGSYRAAGSVTFHGETLLIAAPLAIDVVSDSRLHVTGSGGFDLRDFGIEPPSILGLKVHPDVAVWLDAHAEAD